MATRGLLHVFICVVGCAAVVATPAAAQDGETRIDPLSGIAACPAIADAAARLACFDREYAALDQARQDKRVAVVDRGEVRETRRALFGLSLPKLRLFDREAEDEEEQSFSGTVRGVSAARGGRWVVQIDDTVWQTTETGYFQTPPKVGMPATVTRGLLGSYRMSIDGKNGLKAVRVR